MLFRASHHSMMLEAELARANIPFHKYGGLKFVETAHVKDLMAFLRLAENPRDVVSGTRLLPLLPGIGPGKARQLMDTLLAAGGNFDVWAEWQPPAGAAKLWPKFVALLQRLGRHAGRLAGPDRTACGSSTRRCWRRSTTTSSRGSATWSSWS